MQEVDEEGYSMKEGSALTWFEDDLDELGYTIKNSIDDASIENLTNMLKNGPVLCSYESSETTNHAVVITGVKDDFVHRNLPR